MENQDLSVLNLKQENDSVHNKLYGTGVNPLRALAIILILLGCFLGLWGIIQIGDSNSYHPERMTYGIICISGAISCFVFSPFCRAIATIAEAAKIYKDKNSIEGNN